MNDALRAARKVGRYRLERRLGGGGMGEVYLATAFGDGGFARKVAVKRLRDDLARKPEFVSMLLDEARLASAVRSPNVATTIDVVQDGGEFFVVMEYIAGHSLEQLVLEDGDAVAVPASIAAYFVLGVLRGLSAAHEARDADGQPLHLVHRDVSPHNVLVGEDGIVRLIDFGIAKARDRMQTTRTGQVKGKPSYMAPEQLLACDVDERTDLFAVGAMFWEMLTGRRFRANERMLARFSEGEAVREPLADQPSTFGAPASYDAIIMRALEMSSDARFASAEEMILAVERAGPVASPDETKAWIGARVRIRTPGSLTALDVLLDDLSGVRDADAPPTSAPEEIRAIAERPRRAIVSYGVLALLLATIAAGLAAVRFSERAPSALDPPAASPAASPSSVDSASPAHSRADPAEARAAPPPSVEHPQPQPQPPPPRLRPRAPGAGSRSAASAAVDCREPFIVTSDGTKVPRRECFP